MSITVYTKNHCPKCHITKKFLNSNGIEFEERNINDEPKYLEKLKQDGYKVLPVVKTEYNEWGDLNMPNLNKLKNKLISK